jgi:filamentous hemagglutinin
MNLLTALRQFIQHHRRVHLGFTVLLILFSTLPPAVAADILRSGGGAATSAGQAPVTGLGNAPANVISNRSNARDILIRSQTAQSAARALQAQARAAALAGANNLGTNPNNPAETLPNVPNGLGAGGLEVDPGVGSNPNLWTWANLPTQSTSGAQTNVTVVQTAQQALLNWRTFNIGRETTLTFDQTAGGANQSQWIAFNKVNDPSGRPSQILGSIRAAGQVYVINQNGIIFGGSSQVNTHALVASALPINDNLIQRGLLNNPDAQFLFSALALNAGTKGPTPGFTPAAPVNGRSGDVIVQAGAKIESPTNASNVGGRVALVGANVINRGTISTPDGQTILAAGLQVGFVAHSGSDPSLRGLDTFVGAVVDPLSAVPEYAGTAKNEGIIDAQRANVTIAGKSVEQNGIINSSTSVALNGRIDLQANYGAVTNTGYDPVLLPNIPPFLFTKSGSVKLGAGSITQILPELTSTETVIGTELALRSQVNIQGKAIHFGEDSVLLAPNGIVHADAGVWDLVSGVSPQSYFVHSGGQIYVDRGAVLNVAGTTDVDVSVDKFLIEVELRAAELAGSPLLRDGPLRGQTITVDIRNTGTYNGKTWVGTPLADITGYVNNIQRTVGELTIAGGTIDLNAGGSVVVRETSEINTSGGWINYTGATLETTKLVAGNRIYDISQATPDIAYTGILPQGSTRTDLKWAVVDQFNNPVRPGGSYFDPGYLHGANGGTLKITAPAVALDGRFIGRTTPGPNQRVTGPRPSEFILKMQAQELLAPIYPVFSPTPPTITFQSGVTQTTAADFALDANGNPTVLASDRIANVYLAPELLTRDGFGRFTVENVDGDINVPVGVTLRAAPRNSITLAGANLNIFGNLMAPNGQLNLTAYNISPSAAAAIQRSPFPVAPPANAGRGIITVGSGATLSVAGSQLDDRVGSAGRLASPTAIHGGTITLRAFTANLASGSTLNVSGGFLVSPQGAITYGYGGTLNLFAGQDATLGYVTGGRLTLGSTLLGHAGHDGGKLHIQAPQIQTGGTAQHGNTLLLDPEFFTKGGFSDHHLTGLGIATGTPGQFLAGVVVAPGTKIQPVADNYTVLINPKTGAVSTQIVRNPVGLRSLTHLTLDAPGVKGIEGLEIRGDIVLGLGSEIRTDPRGIVDVHGNTVTILGSIISSGGYIDISGNDDSFPLLLGDQTQALTTVYLGSQSVISTAGTRLLVPDPIHINRRLGEVLAGGDIHVSGNIAAASGAVLDVSGASGILDLQPAQTNPNTPYQTVVRGNGLTLPYSLVTIATRVDSNGGSIHLTGGQMFASDATLRGHAGGSTVQGGELHVSSGRFYLPDVIPPVLDTNLVVQQSGATILNLLPDDATAIGRALTTAAGGSRVGRGYFSVDAFTNGGFDSLDLGGAVEFSGPVTINAGGHVHLADSGVLFANDTVTINSSAASIGTDFVPPVRPEDRQSQLPFTNVAPTTGSGKLTLNARNIEVGTTTLQNIGEATLAADNGDLVGNGIFTIAGKLTLRAGQIHPTTANDFLIVAYDYLSGGSTQQGSITIQSSGTRQLPLVAGGTLSLYASRIDQQGTLRSPFGTINLGWDGTGTAPVNLLTGTALAMPVTQQVTLGEGSVTSVSGVDPTTGKGIIVPYGVSFDGTTWIDPRGVDITATGPPEKIINILGASISMAATATIDLRGGGDLIAYRWVKGNGGPVDVLENHGSFAVLPDYQANHSPYSPYNPLNNSTNLISGAGEGYINNSLKVGDRIYLAGSETLDAGFYTLLPARYALLPGGVLVTPQSGSPIGSAAAPDGASMVSGYRYNDLNSTRTVPTLSTLFEVASGTVINKRAEYELLYASSFLSVAADRLNLVTPRLPVDSGYLLLQATQSMNLLGNVSSVPLTVGGVAVGRGASIDINAPGNVVITATPAAPAPGTISLNAQTLSSWNAESLIIGGKRTRDATGTTLTVTSTNITVNNAGSTLSAPDLTLAATGGITLAAGAQISSSGTLNGNAETLRIVGDGSLIRVSQSESASVVRSGVTNAAGPSLNIGAGARLSGGSLTLDSTSTVTTLDPAAVLSANAYTLSSGRISLQLGTGALLANPGLVLNNNLLTSLGTAKSVTLRSYSSLDIYGAGNIGSATLDKLTLSAGEIRGFNQGAGTTTFAATRITIDNSASGSIISTAPVLGAGTLVFASESIVLGAGQVRVNQFANVRLDGLGGIQVNGIGGFSTQGSLTANTSQIVGTLASQHGISADGALVVQLPVNEIGDRISGSLGVSLTLQGSSVTSTTRIQLPGGSFNARATNGSTVIGNLVDVGGVAQTFNDVTKYTNSGDVTLGSATGNVTINSGTVVNLSANAGGGNAGTLVVSAPAGSFTSNGTLRGQGGAGGLNGSFELDAGLLASYATLRNALTAAAFTERQFIRVRAGNVTLDGTTTAKNFRLSADQGSVTVTGTIDASGTTGGSIALASRGDLTLASGARLTVAGQTFDAAGKGGSISLESGTQRNGVIGTGSVSILTGSTLDLSVASKVAGSETTAGSSAYKGQYSGKLHIRAPQNTTFTDVLVNAINGTIVDASSILVEGYRLYDLTSSGGAITSSVQSSIHTNSETFLGVAGTNSANATAITNRLLANNGGLATNFVLAPGAEIINRTGGLTLGTATSDTTADWNLATFRYGAKSAPGVLTLRAAGNLTFFNALSDGFTPTLASSDASWLWLARLSSQNTLLPTNTQSWSYRLTAGADFTAADFRQTQSTTALSANAGSIQLGKDGGASIASGGSNALTSSVIGGFSSSGGRGLFQVIRTGSGDIEINAGRSVQLLNQFSSIYSAGTRVQDATLGGTFDPPSLSQAGGTGSLGAIQQNYPALYSSAGGNVSVQARENIERQGNAVTRELVNNWLYRRGTVNQAGQFDLTGFGTGIGSTTWWVDFSNFFQGVGALGGGHVTLTAGRNITNVDGVVPTNARASKGTLANPLAASQTLLEIGGGDLKVRAGNNIDAGNYYVERGRGTLNAGGQITTNSSRSPGLISSLTGINAIGDSNTWLPTTLFLGKGGFDVSARGDVLLGPVANAFLMPQGLGNSYWNKTYFSTYAADSFVNVSSLGGEITLRTGATVNNVFTPLLQAWSATQQVLRSNSSSNFQPWLRLAENDVAPFSSVVGLMAPTLRVTSYAGDINLVGSLTLFPSATGTVEVLARSSVNGLRPVGLTSPSPGSTFTAWGAATLNVSDADPSAVPGALSPFAYRSISTTIDPTSTLADFLEPVDKLFRESGGTLGDQAVLETKQARHAPGLLHRNDTTPARIYALNGDISGFTLFSPKTTRVIASRDIADVSLYLQHVGGAQDTSIVAAGRDLLPYNANSTARVAANRAGNIVVTTYETLTSAPMAGDLQISGQGTLQVLAGRNLDLGVGSNLADGTGAGLTSIGNGRNPFLAFDGASIIAGAGIGAATGLSGSGLNFTKFITDFVLGPKGADYLKEVSSNASNPITPASFVTLSDDEQKRLALEIFYLVLRDAGRDHNDPDSDGFGNYDSGKAAIAALFPGSTWKGDINTQARDIRTKNGGDITLFAPGGGITLANSILGSPLAPPGIITDAGGNINIFTHTSVNLGISRIFTLRGGNQVIWSSIGDIAAGSSSKTVQAAPPTRVIIDPQSADVATDLAGLATGGGIGVLASVKGVAPGSVDLIAPEGTIDAGDAGIRATGNLNIAAAQVLNAGNISVGGATTGAPSSGVSAPSLGAVTAANNNSAATSSAANAQTVAQNRDAAPKEEPPSIITVEVLGYGGGSDEEDEEEKQRRSNQGAE